MLGLRTGRAELVSPCCAADALVAAGRIGIDLAAARKAEVRRRAEAGGFFGHIAYASLIARKAQ